MALTNRDRTALKITVASWLLCGVLAWMLQQPAMLLIALGVSWLCSQAVFRVVPRSADPASRRDGKRHSQ